MKTKERIFYYDFLRAFAIIAVILCHIDVFYGSLNTPLQILCKLTINDIGRMGVPIFLMISGALLLNRDYELSDFLKRRFARIIYPFIFWMALILGGMFCVNESLTNMWNVFIGNPSIKWYFWTLIGIYLFLPVINSFIQDYGEKGIEYFLIIWLITIILKTFNHYPLFPNFSLDYFTSYIGYPILGYYLANKEFKLNKMKLIMIGIIIFLVSIISFVYLDYHGLIGPIYLNIPMILMVSSFYVIFKNINKLNSMKNNWIGKIITSLSICSYGMYFSHVIVLKALSLFNPHSNLLFPVMVILMIFLSWLAVFIVSKIPYLKFFSGV